MTETLALTLAYLVDLIIGDPRWMPHPVRVMGLIIGKLETALRNSIDWQGLDQETVNKEESEGESDGDVMPRPRVNLNDIVPPFLRKDKALSVGAQEKIAGAVLVAIMVAGTFVSFLILNTILDWLDFNPIAEYISFGIYVFLVSTTLATRGLIGSALGVIRELGRGNINFSRDKLSMIVGRDTQNLQEAGILKATIETLSENASDGITAPLFYFVLGGLPLAMTYKAINTLDSMIGYKNEKYQNFGWAAAKLDDIANYIPARITGGLIVAAVYFINACRFIVSWGAEWLEGAGNRMGRYVRNVLNWIEGRIKGPDFESARSAYTIMLRDWKKHSSPNAGVPEAAMAGALGVKLGGPSTYEGVEVVKPYIGNHNLKGVFKPGSAEAYMEAALAAVAIIKLTSFLGFLLAILVI
ncbi:MAG: cobalamin biosynthesis protein CobD [Nitrospira sp.]|nr:cobalamin biosynthesis protein CobD [Nitrospira sp.]